MIFDYWYLKIDKSVEYAHSTTKGKWVETRKLTIQTGSDWEVIIYLFIFVDDTSYMH